MDALQASITIKRILEDTNRFNKNTLCTLVDGDWGIGKTHLIKNYFEQEVQYEVIYVSTFGKNSVKEIESTLLINLIPGFKDVKDFGGFSKLLGNFTKDIVDKFAGVNIENYLNSFSIEDFKNNKKDSKKKVICFDDLERKSDSINMKEMLGLIERATINFDVILIANTKEFGEEDLNVFNLYKEKVVDHVIKINKLNRETLKLILDGVDEPNKDEIIDIYLENIIAFGSSPKGYLAENMNNLRIFLKYLELILRSKEHIRTENIDKELLRMCKAVVYDYYFPIKTKGNKQMNFDKFNIYNDLKKLLIFENISIDSFKSYKSEFSEIRQDIKTLYNLYRLNDEELGFLIKKIDKEISRNEFGYFIDQTSTISLASALDENKMLDGERYKELLRIAIEIYAPKENSTYVPFKHTLWNDVDMFGNEMECSKKIKSFIEELNGKCKDKYNSFMNEIITNCMQAKDYERLLMLFKNDEINEFSQFEEIFDYYFSKLEIQYSQENQEKIEKLIQVTKSELIGNYFVERINKDNSITNKKKYQYFDYAVDIKMYHESQMEHQIEYQMNHPED
ncbi:P-loop NTPase fold protein [Psychrobacillus sp. FSL K6-1415]|uniref:P-loop NTPase fold protein n=1 Tax=Psychrobacillus sp. FSL K6-1415 TaxID=2921544 RepID=UPI0030F94E2D